MYITSISLESSAFSSKDWKYVLQKISSPNSLFNHWTITSKSRAHYWICFDVWLAKLINVSGNWNFWLVLNIRTRYWPTKDRTIDTIADKFIVPHVCESAEFLSCSLPCPLPRSHAAVLGILLIECPLSLSLHGWDRHVGVTPPPLSPPSSVTVRVLEQ